MVIIMAICQILQITLKTMTATVRPWLAVERWIWCDGSGATVRPWLTGEAMQAMDLARLTGQAVDLFQRQSQRQGWRVEVAKARVEGKGKGRGRGRGRTAKGKGALVIVVSAFGEPQPVRSASATIMTIVAFAAISMSWQAIRLLSSPSCSVEGREQVDDITNICAALVIHSSRVVCQASEEDC